MLKDGGRFLFGSADWQADLPEREQSLSRTLEVTETCRRLFDPRSRTILAHTVALDQDGSQREHHRQYWYPTARQMAALLYQARFDVEGQFNDFSYLPFDPNRPGLVWLAQKP